MAPKEKFLKRIMSEFPDDRLTFQKRLATFHPESAEEAARFIKAAGVEGQQLYITGYGNNIDPVGEKFADLVIVRTDRLNQVLEISETDLFIRVGAGFPLREINTILKERELYLPHAAPSDQEIFYQGRSCHAGRGGNQSRISLFQVGVRL